MVVPAVLELLAISAVAVPLIVTFPLPSSKVLLCVLTWPGLMDDTWNQETVLPGLAILNAELALRTLLPVEIVL